MIRPNPAVNSNTSVLGSGTESIAVWPIGDSPVPVIDLSTSFEPDPRLSVPGLMEVTVKGVPERVELSTDKTPELFSMRVLEAAVVLFNDPRLKVSFGIAIVPVPASVNVPAERVPALKVVAPL